MKEHTAVRPVGGAMLGVRNLVTVCLNRAGNDLSGEAWHCYDKEPIAFDGVDALALKLDQLFDRLEMPQHESWFRTFTGGKKGFLLPVIGPLPDKVLDQKEILEKRGEQATFVIHVQHRKNSTWQGTLLWTESNRWFTFRSVLELFKLMDRIVNRDVLHEQPSETSVGAKYPA